MILKLYWQQHQIDMKRDEYDMNDAKAQSKARVATALVGILVLLSLFFISFTVQQQEEEELEEGILVNFGTTDFGSGVVQPQQINEQASIPQEAEIEEENQSASEPEASTTEIPREEVVLTQKEETVAAPKESKKAEKVTPQPKETNSEGKSETKSDAETDNDAQETKPTVNERALYPGSRNTNSSGEGVTGNNGDQGQPDGSPDRGAYDGVNSGLGDSGIGYSLSGRKLISPPKLTDNSNAQGKITIKIKVDQSGRVISASLGTPTTISSNALIKKSIDAAKKARFDRNLNAAEEQFGTMTFVFKVT